MKPANQANLFCREGQSYLGAAVALHAAEACDDPLHWKHRNPIFFLLLHATELALKSVTLSRGIPAPRTHDIVSLAKGCARTEDRTQFRSLYQEVRELRKSKLAQKWGGSGDASEAAVLQIEMETLRKKRVAVVHTFKILGALGQSQMQKLEFGEEVEGWWHAARYPRFGTTTYPDFSESALICKTCLELATSEIGNSQAILK